MASGLILLAEDNERLRRLYSDFLGHHGYTVVTATNGTEVVPLLHKLTPSMVILDIMMPEMDGIQTCREVRKVLGAHTPILFLTASDNLDKLKECMEAGGDDYMIKSSELSAILERVNYWIKSSSRGNPMKRRDRALQDINTVVETGEVDTGEIDTGDVETGDVDTGSAADLSSKTDATVRAMTVFVAQARAEAPGGFGKTVDEKLYLLGYIAGVARHWSEIEKSVSARFADYLRAVLGETGLLEPRETARMMDSYDELSSEKTFRKAQLRGQHDCMEAEDADQTFTPTGLAKLAASAA